MLGLCQSFNIKVILLVDSHLHIALYSCVRNESLEHPAVTQEFWAHLRGELCPAVAGPELACEGGSVC